MRRPNLLPQTALVPKVQRLPPRAEPARLVSALEFVELLAAEFWQTAWPTWLFWLLLVGGLVGIASLLEALGLF